MRIRRRKKGRRKDKYDGEIKRISKETIIVIIKRMIMTVKNTTRKLRNFAKKYIK